MFEESLTSSPELENTLGPKRQLKDVRYCAAVVA
jgi:hypothetical protein